ncbi:glycogen debranching protein GlgX [bacterium]|nr:glycogen debranching protein GlgX [bacterium]
MPSESSHRFLDEVSSRQSEAEFAGSKIRILRGQALPYGATRTPHGLNFAVVSRHATDAWLVIASDETSKHLILRLDPSINRTGDVWHVRVEGLPDTIRYGWRMDGPRDTPHQFDPNRLLLDPYAKILSCGHEWNDPCTSARMGVVMDYRIHRDEQDRNPEIRRADTIIYELHVRGFTIDPSSGVRYPGTYAGLVEKIDYLRSLGVTSVELLPVDEFDENDCPFVNPITGERLRNFWGYNTVSYAAIKSGYSWTPRNESPWNEFCGMIQAFHHAGMEVILDVVYNHTAEGDDRGPVQSFKGLDNCLYYMLDETGRYRNFTGCGNTVNSNHPIVRDLVLKMLEARVSETGVDGLRFDLASVLGRDRYGHALENPPLVERISENAILARSKLIAEPWDAGGLYQVGSFPGGKRWMAWNGQYRDDVRRFWTGHEGMLSALATRICGSPDLFGNQGPTSSVNFVTCHDGFTLYDLVSYNHKHNEANGENNRDGSDANYSWNCGVEGPTDDPQVIALRHRLVRNFLATLLVSQGVPMIMAGDEFLRTQQGNNNAWCQDNEISWVDWSLAESNADLVRFTREMIALRKRHPVLRRDTFPRGDGIRPDIVWHGTRPFHPDFSRQSHFLAFTLDGHGQDRGGAADRDIYVGMNAWREAIVIEVPHSPTGRQWRLAVETGALPPKDIFEPETGPQIGFGQSMVLPPYSMLILVSEE